MPEKIQQLSERALVARINRRLNREGQTLRLCREDSRWFLELGRYYIVDDRNNITAQGVSLEALAADLGVM